MTDERREDSPPLTEEDIQLLCTEKSFRRGENYYRRGAIRDPLRQGGTLQALYEGSQRSRMS
ncbi:MAG: hypothetical protein U9Q78_07790 [Chloroflexota bacterium]|nr:hypothetical protein [Chloroflexota bacterium]